MDWHIVFKNPSTGKKFQLRLLASVEIEQSVENLCDIASIQLPEAVMNNVLQIENKIGRGSEVIIDLGYNGNLVREFTGFITEIKNNDSSLKIICEDSIFLFRKSVSNEVLKPTSVAQIAQRLIDQIDPTIQLSCDYDIGYEKFVINQAEGYDVLKKLQEETKANIYFNNETRTLHIDAPFKGKGKNVRLEMDKNIESSSLEYKRAIDRKIEVTVEGISADGKVNSIKSGVAGGETITIKAPQVKLSDLQKIADSEVTKRSADRYDGSVDLWLIPITRPTDTLKFKDPDYPERSASYYCVSTKLSFSDGGGKRTVGFGIKLS